MSCATCGATVGAMTFYRIGGVQFHLCARCKVLIYKPWYDAARAEERRVRELRVENDRLRAEGERLRAWLREGDRDDG